MDQAAAIVGLVMLLFGRKLYWLFVGAVGFLFGMQLAGFWFTDQAGWAVFLIGLLVGAVGAVLAIVFQRVAVAIAGFLAGGQLGVMLLGSMSSGGDVAMITFLFCGVIAAIVVLLLFDWALILVSAFFGAAYVAQGLNQPPAIQLLIMVVLFVVGIIVQGLTMRVTERRVPAEQAG